MLLKGWKKNLLIYLRWTFEWEKILFYFVKNFIKERNLDMSSKKMTVCHEVIKCGKVNAVPHLGRHAIALLYYDYKQGFK